MIACPSCGTTARNTAKFCQNCGGSFTATGNLTGILANRYLVTEKLGKGGMGAVYKAVDTNLNRVVAVKEMGQSTLTGVDYQQAIHDFKREAQLLARLDHPMLPKIYEHFTDSGRWYLTMDFIEGKTLEDGLPFWSINYVIELMIHVCTVISYLHAQSILFRDLKPANIMLTPSGKVRLIDFGIARVFQGQGKDTTALGSPGWAAPEQYKKGSTPKSDIYALGAVLHFLLSGDDPSDHPFHFEPRTVLHTGNAALQKLDNLLTRMTSLDQTKRPDADDVLAQLQSILDEHRANPGIATADYTVFVVSSLLDGSIHAADARLIDDIHDQMSVYAKNERKTLETISVAKTTNDFDRIIRKADLVYVLCTPDLLASKYARNAVGDALDYRIRIDIRVVPINGIQCPWESQLIHLAALFALPRDRKPIGKRTGALQEAAKELYECFTPQKTRTPTAPPPFPGIP